LVGKKSKTSLGGLGERPGYVVWGVKLIYKSKEKHYTDARKVPASEHMFTVKGRRGGAPHLAGYPEGKGNAGTAIFWLECMQND